MVIEVLCDFCSKKLNNYCYLSFRHFGYSDGKQYEICKDCEHELNKIIEQLKKENKNGTKKNR